MQEIIITIAQAQERVFALDQQTFIQIGIQILNGIILAVALGLIFYKPVKKFMAERTKNIETKIDVADTTMAKAEKLIAEYESKIQNIDAEYEKVLEEGRLKAAAEEKIIIEEAREEAERIKAEALKSGSLERERIRAETRPLVIELATTLAERYVKVSINEETQDKLYDEVLSELEDARWRR
ncbi:MAG: ATP synthase F0 subunit B [Eubacteriales bacterium]|nr:ATP synthase F0 subunit B [Eubacteriales bacterium]MDD4542086.1 ATP synthase F0 subunit B [Eubacteriales bacterium]